MSWARQITVRANGADHGCAVLGPEAAPLALLLHGFPDTPATWRHLAPMLVRRGFRVVAPALRGFAPTTAPPEGPAGAAVLGADANALHAALGGTEKAILIGHDWGAAAAYAASGRDPARWSRVIAASWPPHLAAVDLASPAQMRRSWYVFLLQLAVAEEVVRADDLAFVDGLWADWSPGHDRAEDVARAKAALRGAMHLPLAIRHYRTLFTDAAPPALVAPLLYIHGARDGSIGAELLTRREVPLPEGSRVVVLPDAGHFPQLEAPEAFAACVLDWIERGAGAAAPA